MRPVRAGREGQLGFLCLTVDVARSREAPRPLSAAPAAGWWSFADALLERAVAQRATPAAPADLAAADASVERARRQFLAALAEPSPFAVLVHNAGLGADDAEVLALAAAVEADPARQLAVAHLHGDSTTTRVTLHLLGVAFGDGHAGVRAVGPQAPLRTAALVDVLDDGPWGLHVVAVHPAVMWALAGDTSPDPGLPDGVELAAVAELTGTDGDELDGGERLVAVTGDDAERRRQVAMRRTAGHRFLVTAAPVDDPGWAALVREATIVGASVIVDVPDLLPPAGRRWIDRATHLAWAITSKVELPLDSMPSRAWVDHHAPASEPTDDEWAAV